MKWSIEQEAIYAWFESGLGHLVVVARAGCGKTTTIIEGIGRAPERKKLLAAFNARIAEELQKRCPAGAVAKTMHGVGYGLVLRNWEGIKIDKTGGRAKILSELVCGAKVPDAIKRIVTRLHSLGRENLPMAVLPEELYELAERFECVPDEQWEEAGYDVHRICAYAVAAMAQAADVRPIMIDYSDMIFLPIRNGWLVKTFDMVVIDEAQDMTPAQLTIARGVCKGRICVVGDDRQAIYGFRGADSGSLGRLKTELDAQVLGLKTTYRCATNVVARAAQIVPDFTAAPGNATGWVLDLHTSKLTEAAGPGDFILSRVNAPLVSTAMQLLRAGKRTRIAGKDIGKDLLGLVGRLSRSARSVPEFLARLEGWIERETARAMKLKNPDARLDAIRDQGEMLKAGADGARNVSEIEDRIEALFTNDGLGDAGVITCSSVHKAKGLESSRVFVLVDTLRNDSDEELNIQYVAFTRAKDTLVMVSDFAFERPQEAAAETPAAA